MEEPAKVTKKRGLSSEGARKVRQDGHDDALMFALSIGLPTDYRNDNQAKKDVIDLSGDSHSVKSGEKKWQIFLYGLGRFESDDVFLALNGMGDLLIQCIKSFPPSYDEYIKNKHSAKISLVPHMENLCIKLQDKKRLRAFFNKSFFNGGEVNYLTIKENDTFHVFLNKDVINCVESNITVANSKARNPAQYNSQKVVFRYSDKNIGEIEMRNDSKQHYREVRFNMLKKPFFYMLVNNIKEVTQFNEYVKVYGQANKKFGKWQYVH